MTFACPARAGSAAAAWVPWTRWPAGGALTPPWAPLGTPPRPAPCSSCSSSMGRWPMSRLRGGAGCSSPPLPPGPLQTPWTSPTSLRPAPQAPTATSAAPRRASCARQGPSTPRLPLALPPPAAPAPLQCPPGQCLRCLALPLPRPAPSAPPLPPCSTAMARTVFPAQQGSGAMARPPCKCAWAALPTAWGRRGARRATLATAVQPARRAFLTPAPSRPQSWG